LKEPLTGTGLPFPKFYQNNNDSFMLIREEAISEDQ